MRGLVTRLLQHVGFAVQPDHRKARARTFFGQGNCYPAGAGRQLQDRFRLKAPGETYIKDYVLFISHVFEVVFMGPSIEVSHMQCSMSLSAGWLCADGRKAIALSIWQ